MPKTMPKPTPSMSVVPASTEAPAVTTAAEVIHLALEKSEGVLPEGEYLKLANALKVAHDLTKSPWKTKTMEFTDLRISCGKDKTITEQDISLALVRVKVVSHTNRNDQSSYTWRMSVGDATQEEDSDGCQNHPLAFLKLHSPSELKVEGMGPTFTIQVYETLRRMEEHNDAEEDAQGYEGDEYDEMMDRDCVYARFVYRMDDYAKHRTFSRGTEV